MSSKPNLQMNTLTWLLLILLSVLWGGSFFFVELAVKDLPTLTIVLGRVTIAAIVLNLYVVFSGQRMPRSFKLWFAFFVMGALNNFIPFSLIAWGQIYIESGLAAILNAATPLFTVVLAHFFTKDERMTRNRFAGVILGLLGVIILIGPEALTGLGGQALAQLAVLGAAISYAIAGIYGKRFKDIPSLISATGMLTGSSLMMLPVAAIVDKPWTLRPSLISILSVLGLALLCSVLAYLIFFHILSVAGATNLVLVTLLIPVSAILLGTLILGEQLHWTAFAGMVLILAGLIAVDGRLIKFREKAS